MQLRQFISGVRAARRRKTLELRRIDEVNKMNSLIESGKDIEASKWRIELRDGEIAQLLYMEFYAATTSLHRNKVYLTRCILSSPHFKGAIVKHNYTGDLPVFDVVFDVTWRSAEDIVQFKDRYYTPTTFSRRLLSDAIEKSTPSASAPNTSQDVKKSPSYGCVPQMTLAVRPKPGTEQFEAEGNIASELQKPKSAQERQASNSTASVTLQNLAYRQMQ